MPFDIHKFNRLQPIPNTVMRTRGNFSREQRGLQGLGQGFAASIGGISINDNGGWNISTVPSGSSPGGVPIVSGTSPTLVGSHCPDPVPIQNAIQQYILSPISDQVSYNVANLTLDDLNMLASALLQTQNNWLAYLHNPTCLANSAWAGRSRGAEATLAPYFNGLANKIQSLISAGGSGGSGVNIPTINPYPVQPGGTTGPIVPTTIGGMSTATLALLAVGAYFLLKK